MCSVGTTSTGRGLGGVALRGRCFGWGVYATIFYFLALFLGEYLYV